jgi:hypothetical protein
MLILRILFISLIITLRGSTSLLAMDKGNKEYYFSKQFSLISLSDTTKEALVSFDTITTKKSKLEKKDNKLSLKEKPNTNWKTTPLSNQSLDSLNANELKSYLKSFFVNRKQKIDFYGNLSIESHYSNWQDTLSRFPAKYTRISFSPAISVFGLPFKSNLLYTTDEGFTREKLKNLNFSLDVNRLQQEISNSFDASQKELNRLDLIENLRSPGLNLADNFDIPSKNSIQFQRDNRFISRTNLSEGNIRILNNIHKLNQLDGNAYKNLMDSITNGNPETHHKVSKLSQYKNWLNIKDKNRQKFILDSLKVSDTSAYKNLVELKKLQEIKDFKRGNVESNRKQFNKSTILKTHERIALNFSRFNIGDCYPLYTSLTLSGSRITGLDVAYNPGKYYIALTTGNIKQIKILTSDSFEIEKKNLIAGSIGLGQKTASHIHLNFLRVDGSKNYLQNFSNPLGQNLVLGTDVLLIYRKFAKFEFEIAQSQTQDELRTSGSTMSLFYKEHLDSTNKNRFQPENYAFRTCLSLMHQKTNTMLSAEIKKVGGDYFSVGVPFMRSDNLLYSVKAQKKMLSNQVFIEATWTKDKDNLMRFKPNTTTVQSIGANVGLTFKKLPYLLISYMPFTQDSKYQDPRYPLDTLKRYYSSFQIVNIVSGYQGYWGSTITNTQVSYLYQKEQTFSGGNPVTRKLCTLSEIIKFEFPLQTNFIFNYYFPEPVLNPLAGYSADASILYTSKEKYGVELGWLRNQNLPLRNKNSIYSTLIFSLKHQQSINFRICLSTIEKKETTVDPLRIYEMSLKYNFLF